jgi:hypothetical protein
MFGQSRGRIVRIMPNYILKNMKNRRFLTDIYGMIPEMMGKSGQFLNIQQNSGRKGRFSWYDASM